MRLKSIPCKFITGLCLSLTNNRHSLHVWAEVYDETLGWVPVCPQSGCFGVPRFFVKTHQGLDFNDAGANFSKFLFKLKGFKEIE
jgi:transglutaminase-like putative cysteine protease